MKEKFLYHGTTESAGVNIIQNGVILGLGRKSTDFGQGFYLAQKRNSALVWAKRLGRRYKDNGVLLYFTIDLAGLEVKFFKADNDWLEEVILQRDVMGGHNDVDVIVGPIADGDTVEELRKYKSGLYSDADEVIALLLKHNYGLQFVIKSEKAKAKLMFHKMEVVYNACEG